MWILKFWRAMCLLHMDRTSDLLCQVWILIVKKYIRSFFTVSYRKVRSYQVPLKLSDLVLTAANKLQWNWMCCLAFRLYNKLQLLLHKLKNLFFFFASQAMIWQMWLMSEHKIVGNYPVFRDTQYCKISQIFKSTLLRYKTY